MHRFNKYWNEFFGPLVPGLEAIYKMPEYRPSVADSGSIRYGSGLFSPDCAEKYAPPEWGPEKFWEWMRATCGDKIRITTTWAISGAVGEGPKVYCPTVRECEALAHTAVTLKPEEYRQPFETFMVIIPDGYVFPGTERSSTNRQPCALLSRYDMTVRLWALLVLGRSEQLADGKELAKVKVMDPSETDLEDEITGDTLLPGDCEILAAARRIMANAAMLMVQTGARRIGPSNPEYEAKLREKLKNQRAPASARLQNQRALRMMPVIYGFDQTISIYDEEVPDQRQDGQGGYQVKPHWRRGYWQRQLCGPKDARFHVQQFRKPMLVNAHLLSGPMSNTRVTLTRTEKPHDQSDQAA